MATYNGITYDPSVDYMKLINDANASGNYALAAQYEQQRNAKIAATNSSYAPTNNYTNYASGSNTLGSQTAGNQGVTYNKNTDYQKLINDSVSAGNYSAAAQYEQMRNAKIVGEGINAPTTNNWSSYLGGDVRPEYQEPGTAEYVNQLTGIVNNLLANQYRPVNQEQYMQNAMGYDEAYNLARSIVAPQYADTYEQTARAAQQRLGAAGLSDSLYGQALAAQSENQVNKDMNAAIGNLALQIQDMSYDQAYKLLQSAMQENQYGNSSRVNALGTAANATANIIGALQDAANERNDFALQAASLQLDQQAQALKRQYFQGQLTAQQLENEMAKLELDAARTAMDNNVATTAVYSSGGGRSGGGSSGSSSGGGYTRDEPLVNTTPSYNYNMADIMQQILTARTSDQLATVNSRLESATNLSAAEKSRLRDMIASRY